MPRDIGKSDIRHSATLEAFLQVQRELPQASPQEQQEWFYEIVESNPALRHEINAAMFDDIIRELKEEEAEEESD